MKKNNKIKDFKQKLIERMKESLEFIEEEDMNEIHWGTEEGILISGNEAEYFIKLLEEKKQ